MDSRLSGFYKGSPAERRQALIDAGVDPETVESLRGGKLGVDGADAVSENVVGTLEYPIGIATNFQIDGEDTLVPMAVEETSVVAAASFGARMARGTGGFTRGFGCMFEATGRIGFQLRPSFAACGSRL